jgi:septum formation protein
MIALLSGRSHVVLTAIAVARDGRTESAVEEVEVTFRALTDAEIAAYVATGEPMDKAGAYGIQGWGATIVERVERRLLQRDGARAAPTGGAARITCNATP